MREQSYKPSEPVDLDTAIRIGKLIGAEGVVMGEVTGIPRKFNDYWHYKITLVNTGTGQYVWYADASNVNRGEIAKILKEELNKK
jgi:hypothetical protein